jgi:hypothetical protein
MTDNATIAAILASGMLPPILAPATNADGVIGAGERRIPAKLGGDGKRHKK